jgi:hypothetical protein
MKVINMPLLDYTIYVLGIYGLSWLITQSAILFEPRDWLMTKFDFMDGLLGCIVCTSVWLSSFFVYFYFPNELWFTKIILVGSTTTTTWALASYLNDLE